MNKDRIISELSLIQFGNKGWMNSDATVCPECGRSDKIGIMFSNQGGVAHCQRCGTSTSLYSFLSKINRTDLIEGFSAPIEDALKSLNKEVEVLHAPIEECALPRDFKRIYYDDYLDERGFTPYQYGYFGVGVSTDISLRHHLIFPIYQDGKLVSWLGRTRYSKEWHKNNIDEYKHKGARLIPRYKNSTGTEFSDILAFSDDIIPKVTDTVILVEGLFDKANVDRLLNLYDREDTKCCFTFGKHISRNQSRILRSKKVKRVIFMYDPDAMAEIERHSLQHFNVFEEVMCAKLTDSDPGDMDARQMDEVMSSLRSPFEFYFTNIKTV